MSEEKIKVGSIVLVKDENDNFKLARVVNVTHQNEEAVVMYLSSSFEDLYLDTVSLLNCSLYSNRKVE